MHGAAVGAGGAGPVSAKVDVARAGTVRTRAGLNSGLRVVGVRLSLSFRVERVGLRLNTQVT